MKYQTLQKTALAAMALLTSLALSAQAGTHATVSSAKQKGGSHNRGQGASSRASFHRILFPDSTYMIDDGTAEDAVGFGDGASNIESLWFNQFNVIPGQTTITSVSVAWGTPVLPDPTLNGTPITAAVWSDPNGDGNPSDAVLLGSVAGTIQNAGTDTFVTYTFSPPVTLPAGATSFFVGDMTPAFSGGFEQFYQGIDENSALHRQSWVAANANSSAPVNINMPGQNDTVGLIDDFGLPGNWLIRADTGAVSPTPTPTATPTPSSTPTPTPTATPAGALWYNGDFDGTDGLANEQDTFAPGYAHVYDDFNVTDDAGWDVSSVYSNDLISTTVTGATWEIRQGVSAGNGGTVVASGMTSTPSVTPTGRDAFGFTEYMVEVSGLGVHLAPGTYFLNVTPIGDLDGNRSFDSTTSGANCIGTPCGNDDNSFFDAPVLFGVNFGPTSDQGAQFHDFSMGVNGEVTGGGGGGDLTLVSAVSRKTQGGSDYDVNLPLSGGMGIEDRDGGKDTLVLNFANNITNAGTATSSCGSAGVTIDPNDAHNLIVTVGTSHCNGQTITVTINGASDDQGNSGSATVSYGKLLGDVNGDGIVNNKDAAAVRNNSPRHVNSSNFRDDVNVDGSVNNKDLYFVKANRGSSL
ncbi:MAG TPA: dockerin type I domain-containing protein [Gemmatimonadaceae bacterium]